MRFSKTYRQPYRNFLAAVLSIVSSDVALFAADAPVDRFLQQIEKNATIPADARELIKRQWADCKDCDPEEFLTQALAVISPRLREGLDAYDADQYPQSAAIMHELASDADPFVAVHAAVYEIKALVALERMLEAGARLADLSASPHKVDAYSYFQAEVDFLRAYSALSDLRYEEAEAALKRFLLDHADASARLTIAARQMLMELANREPEKLGDVVDLMDFSGKRLKSEDVGEPVRTRQQRILDLLDKLIKEEEEKEKQSSSSSGGGSGSGTPNNSPSNPMQQSQLPGGAPEAGQLRAARRANPGEAWGAMPPAERERVLQALRGTFPTRYRQLVEQYYEELSKKP